MVELLNGSPQSAPDRLQHNNTHASHSTHHARAYSVTVAHRRQPSTFNVNVESICVNTCPSIESTSTTHVVWYRRLKYIIPITIILMLIMALSICIAIFYPRSPGIKLHNLSTHNMSTYSDSNDNYYVNLLLNVEIELNNPNYVDTEYSDTVIPLFINSIEAGELFLPGM